MTKTIVAPFYLGHVVCLIFSYSLQLHYVFQCLMFVYIVAMITGFSRDQPMRRWLIWSLTLQTLSAKTLPASAGC